jgi:hypothetical protein
MIWRNLERQAAELDDDVLHPETLGLALVRALELAHTERRAGHVIPSDHEHDDAERQQDAEVADHRHLGDPQAR